MWYYILHWLYLYIELLKIETPKLDVDRSPRPHWRSLMITHATLNATTWCRVDKDRMRIMSSITRQRRNCISARWESLRTCDERKIVRTRGRHSILFIALSLLNAARTNRRNRSTAENPPNVDQHIKLFQRNYYSILICSPEYGYHLPPTKIQWADNSKSGGHTFLNMYSILTINLILYITYIIQLELLNI